MKIKKGTKVAEKETPFYNIVRILSKNKKIAIGEWQDKIVIADKNYPNLYSTCCGTSGKSYIIIYYAPVPDWRILTSGTLGGIFFSRPLLLTFEFVLILTCSILFLYFRDWPSLILSIVSFILLFITMRL